MKQNRYVTFLSSLIPDEAKRLMAIFFLLYVVSFFLLLFLQRSLIYLPSLQDFDSCPAFSGAQKLSYGSTRFYYKDISDKVIVFYHGNYGSACDRAFLASWFEAAGYSYIFPEYAGYARDSRSPSKDLILEDVRNIDAFVAQLHPNALAVMGESLGTGPASYEASLGKVAGLILVSPYPSLVKLTAEKLPIYPISLMLREDYDNEVWLQSFQGKVIILYGDKDVMVQPGFSKELFVSIPSGEKQIDGIRGAGHFDLYNFSETENAIRQFLSNF